MSSVHTGEPETPDAQAATSRHAHPEPREYVKVALVLAFVTGLEIAMYYIKGLSDAVVITSLMVMMVIKFALVALWFMHLRFDSLIFRRLFFVGLFLAIFVFSIVLLTFGVFVGD